MSRKAKYVIVNTTVATEKAARALARQVVAGRLAACVQYLPIRSIYRGKGSVESASECLLLAKTRATLARGLVRFIRKRHAYEVPEILVTSVKGGLADYLSWISAETANPKRKGDRR
jgi:periplasmic divalent cation tolerance protein